MNKIDNRLVVSCAIGFSLWGCGGTGFETEDWAMSEQGLISNEDFEWDQHGIRNINVCWDAASGAAGVAEPNAKTDVRAAIRDNWQRYARVNLLGWGSCPATFDGIRVLVDNRLGWEDQNHTSGGEYRSGFFQHDQPIGLKATTTFGGVCSVSNAFCDASHACPSGQTCQVRKCQASRRGCVTSADCATGDTCQSSVASTQICFNSANYTTCNQSLALHEFGHMLGFWHEENRPSYTPGVTAGTDGNGNGVNDVGEGLCASQATFWDDNNYDEQLYGAYDIRSVMSYCGQADVLGANTGEPGDTNPMDDWKVAISPGDIAAVQRAYGRRIPGTLLTQGGGQCADANFDGGNGTAATWQDCSESAKKQVWHSPASGNDRFLRLTSGGVNRCLTAASSTDGAAVVLGSCSSSTDWAFENVYIRGWGGLCLDVPAGNTTNGTRVQLWECGAQSGVNQKWSVTGSKIRFGSYTGSKCLRQDSNNLLVIGDCTATQTDFSFDSSGRITGASSLCMDVSAQSDAQYLAGEGLPGNGLKMTFFTCNSSLNQKWNMSGRIAWGQNHSLCLARTSFSVTDRSLMLETCGGTGRQKWDSYFTP